MDEGVTLVVVGDKGNALVFGGAIFFVRVVVIVLHRGKTGTALSARG